MLRDYYFIPTGSDGEPVVELRAFTHGLMPRSVPEMLEGFVDDWQEWGVDAWNGVPNRWLPASGESVGWWELPVYLGDRFIAPLLGAPAGTCIHQPNAHWTVSCLLSADQPFEGGRRRVICSELDFPSVLHTVQRWAGLRDLEPVIISPNASGFLDVDALIEAIDEQTAMVFLSHVGFTSGERIPDDVLIRVAERARRHGALFVIDGYHAASTFPVDVREIGCDVYLGGLLKEGSGSSGNAYVYIRDGGDLDPRIGGWFGEAEPFAFGASGSPHPEVRRRFLGGTTAVAPLYHAVEGIRLLLGAGLGAVREHSLALTGRAIERSEAAGVTLRSPSERERRGAMVILEVERADLLCSWLKQREVHTDSRKQRYLRLAPYVWNSLDEVDRAFDAIEEAVASGAHLRLREASPSGGPVT